MASPKNLLREPSLAIILSLRRWLEWDREYRHSRTQGGAAPRYVEIRDDVKHHRKIEREIQALGYEHAWQGKRWRFWLDSDMSLT